MKLGLRNIIGNTVSGSSTPSVDNNYLLWKPLSVNKLNVRSSNNDKLIWKQPTP